MNLVSLLRLLHSTQSVKSNPKFSILFASLCLPGPDKINFYCYDINNSCPNNVAYGQMIYKQHQDRYNWADSVPHGYNLWIPGSWKIKFPFQTGQCKATQQ